MNRASLERCIISISRWYFLEFYLFFYTKTIDEQQMLINNPDLFREAIYAHYDLVRRVEVVNPGGFEYRKNQMYKLLTYGEMHNALRLIITETNKRILRNRAQQIHEIIHGEPYQL
jgi:hypothetical protein